MKVKAKECEGCHMIRVCVFRPNARFYNCPCQQCLLKAMCSSPLTCESRNNWKRDFIKGTYHYATYNEVKSG